MVDFDTNAGLLKTLGVSVYALSVDDGPATKKLNDGLRLNYVQLGHSLDAPAVSAATGANLESGDRVILSATGFLLDPEGRINTSVFSTGPIGRFTANDVMKKVRFAQDQAAN